VKENNIKYLIIKEIKVKRNEKGKMTEKEPETNNEEIEFTTTESDTVIPVGSPAVSSTTQKSSPRSTYKPPDPRIQPVTPRNKIARNKPCPCGSGKKYKKCCLNKYKG